MRYRYRNDEELKDSGVEWIGKIPKDWSLIKLKYISHLKSESIFLKTSMMIMVNIIYMVLME